MLAKVLQFCNHTWRRFATGLCFAVFGLGGLVMSLTALPLLKLRAYGEPEKQQQMAKAMVQRTFRFFIGFMRFTGVFNFAFPAREQLQHCRGQVIIANHPCLIDIVALISFVPNADCVVKAHLWRNPFMRGVIKSSGYISNGDPEGLIIDCERSLAQGNNLIIFPEGTRTEPGKPFRFQRGPANLALRTQNDMMALRICCDPVTLIKNEPWYCAPPKKPTLTIEFLRAVPTTSYQTEQPSIAARQLTRDLEAYYNKVLESNGKYKT
ncbi:lysophospholipid acyltransferase family protein [Pseudidiomarina aquimaris]|uniref:1-acyl-sn-glycerol-3-phosphate acyltransferase n=2 Tax=Pseudidiomarina aquimaris TaxID=641841 RepID=A0A432XH61_9GAMM|nr:1-acyl-sn-glycerol-3-phosphate acyltransferase [Pseudidiomarina aquimaris]